jgi:hypothetical protein
MILQNLGFIKFCDIPFMRMPEDDPRYGPKQVAVIIKATVSNVTT